MKGTITYTRPSDYFTVIELLRKDNPKTFEVLKVGQKRDKISFLTKKPMTSGSTIPYEDLLKRTVTFSIDAIPKSGKVNEAFDDLSFWVNVVYIDEIGEKKTVRLD